MLARLRQGLAFGSEGMLQDFPTEEAVKLELHHFLSGETDNQRLHLTAQVTLKGAELPCENVVWYTIRKDTFYLSLQPDLHGCSGEIELPEGEWDIRAVFINGLLSTHETLSLILE
jgi:hypothetical protein